MIISKICNKLKEEQKEGLVASLVASLVWGLVWGLVAGLVAGLVMGLVWGLVAGLVVGLVMGLVVGLVWGLVVGLVMGLVWGLVVGLVMGLELGLIPLGWFLLIVFILMELLFWFDNQKPKKKVDKFLYTLQKKGESLLEAGLIMGLILYIIYVVNNLKKEHIQIFIKYIGYMGLGIIGLIFVGGIIILYIYLNSLKYRK